MPDLLVDDGPERVERLRSGEEPAVDEERWSRVHTVLTTLLVVHLDGWPVLARVETLSERRGVEVEVRGELAVRGRGKRALVLEDPVVVLPELSLLVGAERGLRRRLGLGMVRKREVAVDETDFVAVGLLDLLKGRTDPCAERSLEIGVLDDGDGSARWTFHPLALGDGDGNPRRIEGDVDLGLRAQAG